MVSSAPPPVGPFRRYLFVPLFRRVPWPYERQADARVQDDRTRLAGRRSEIRRAVASADPTRRSR
jgi:hypothetical protein